MEGSKQNVPHHFQSQMYIRMSGNGIYLIPPSCSSLQSEHSLAPSKRTHSLTAFRKSHWSLLDATTNFLSLEGVLI